MKQLRKPQEEQADLDGVRAKFMKLRWHDSRLISFHIIKDLRERTFNIELSIDLVIGFSDGDYERERVKLIFKESLFVATDLDLVFIAASNGDISGAFCYRSVSEIEPEDVAAFEESYSIKLLNLLNENLLFSIEMISLSGEILVVADNYELVPNRNDHQ